jgi:hypothetical protein
VSNANPLFLPCACRVKKTSKRGAQPRHFRTWDSRAIFGSAQLPQVPPWVRTTRSLNKPGYKLEAVTDSVGSSVPASFMVDQEGEPIEEKVRGLVPTNNHLPSQGLAVGTIQGQTYA